MSAHLGTLQRACVFVVLVVAACVLSARPAIAAPRKKPAPIRVAAPDPPPPLVESLPSEADADWRQFMMAPALSGNLRAVAVDPSDENNLYVGTQEGTIVHSIDGGITWTEVALSPFTLRSHTTYFEAPGDWHHAIDVFTGMRILERGDYRPYNPLALESAEVGPGHAQPEFTQQYVTAFRDVDSYPSASSPLLESIAGRDPAPFDDIEQIIICPGGANRIFVLTGTKLLGSADGTSFLELFTGRESNPFDKVACSPANPNEVILTSGDGTFRSLDGGFTFETIGQIASSAIAFGPPLEDGSSLLYYVAGAELWIGNSADPDAMNPAPIAAEGWILAIAATAQSIWLATTMGVRVSRDGGNTWAIIDDLEGISWFRIAVATDGEGHEHVIAMNDDITYISTDGGVTFRPSFRAESRRRMRWVIAAPWAGEGPPSFYLLTSGELWTNRPRDRSQDPELAAVRGVAMKRLKEMPTLRELLDKAAIKANLSDRQLDSLHSRWRARAWLPSVDIKLWLRNINVLEIEAKSISETQKTYGTHPTLFFEGNLNLVWEIRDIDMALPGLTEKRVDLYEMRKRLAFFVEDSYLERRQILSQLASGGMNEAQALTLQARLEVLDVVIDEFTNSSRKTHHPYGKE